MKKSLFISLTIIISSSIVMAENSSTNSRVLYNSDSTLNSELDKFWNTLAGTVSSGDFDGYSNSYHEDAVVVFATGENKVSVSIQKALNNWKQGFIDTAEGKKNDFVEFRFSERMGDENTAYEVGMFHFVSRNADNNITSEAYIHFDAVLVKKEGRWLCLVENQKSVGTIEEWNKI